MIDFGAKLGAELRGGEVIELIGDVGAGKTTFTKGLAKGLAIAETVQSPSFTISRVYDGRLELVHYDFYRLNNAGVMALELADNLSDAEKVVVIDAEENMELASRYQVMQAPTLVVVNGDGYQKFVNASNIKKFAERFEYV